MKTFVIAQTLEQTQLAISVHRNAEIGSIRLAKARIGSDDPETALKHPLELFIDAKAKNSKVTAGHLTIDVTFRLAAFRPEGNERDAFSIESVFQAEYELRPGFEPTEEQVDAFKAANAIFNCWPYCRQFAQEMVARMGFPPVTLPFLRVQTREKKTRKSPRPKADA